MKNIYIILTRNNSIISRMVRLYRKDEFSHVSISLDRGLKQMYSFGRLNPYNAFKGGFVHEYIDKGTFKRFSETTCRVYEFPIENNQYEIVKNILLDFEKNKSKYKFNVRGLLGVSINKKVTKKDAFYCVEFLKYVFTNAGIKVDLPKFARPEHLKNLEGFTQIYSGLLREYKE